MAHEHFNPQKSIILGCVDIFKLIDELACDVMPGILVGSGHCSLPCSMRAHHVLLKNRAFQNRRKINKGC
jgi:hypothetical protein